MGTLVVAGICIELIMAALAARIADRKDLSAGGYFFAGLVLGVVGVVIAAIARPNNDDGVMTAADAVAKLERLAALHRSGSLSDAEFAAAKARLLESNG